MSGGPHLWRGDVLAALARLLDYNPAGTAAASTLRSGSAAAAEDGPGSTADGRERPVPHHSRVAALAIRMASRLHGLDPLDTFYAGLLHDIGLLGNVRDPDRWRNLDEQANRPLIRSHPLVGAQMVAEVPELFSVAPIIMDHHECVNGHGYPRGKVGDEIGHAAQVIRFADTCDVILREQASPELMAFLHAVRGRTATQTSGAIADAGVEVLGEPGFYAQLLAAEDVEFLIQSTLHGQAADDYVTTAAEVTGLLELFASVTDTHPADKTGHSRRVAALGVLVAMSLGLETEETTQVKWAALVHDVGMITVPKEILDKPGRLSPEETAEVRRHAEATERLIAPIRGLEEVAAIAAGHGEAYDGSGYPRGLRGREIPIGARILAVCDTFDALTSHRPYREAREASLSIDILVKGSGSLFDPDVVAAAVPAFLIARAAEEPEPVGAV